MSTAELINNIKKTSIKMSINQRRERLLEAHIIKANGEYDPKYFSAETVQNSKKALVGKRA